MALNFTERFEDGKAVFALRYTESPEYVQFYLWTPTTSYKCVYQDFPWDSFVFTDPKDEQAFRAKYGDNIAVEVD